MTSETAAFIVPHFNNGNEKELIWLSEALSSIEQQTDKDWIIILVDDASTSENAINYLYRLKGNFAEKMKLIFLSENKGPGNARNIGISIAYQLGCSFVMYLDQDDIAHPKRLEITRKILKQHPEIDVVYSSFQVIDETGNCVSEQDILPSIIEILEQHRKKPPQGKDVWIKIATETGYVNLTSSTSVRTNVAYSFPFPNERVSEDYYSWLVYSASGSQYIYSALIPAKYRIPRNSDGSRTRSMLGSKHTFNMIKSIVDMRGLQTAMDLASANGTLTVKQIKDIKIRFCLRKAKSMILDDEREIAMDYYRRAIEIDDELMNKLQYVLDEVEDKKGG